MHAVFLDNATHPLLQYTGGEHFKEHLQQAIAEAGDEILAKGSDILRKALDDYREHRVKIKTQTQ